MPGKEESAQSTDQIGWDSHLGQDYSATHTISALRLTLSHTGIALMRIALDLHNALKNNMDTVQRDLAMHTLQQSLLTSSAYAALYLAEGSLLATGAVSASPASLNGSVNWIHKKFTLLMPIYIPHKHMRVKIAVKEAVTLPNPQGLVLILLPEQSLTYLKFWLKVV